MKRKLNVPDTWQGILLQLTDQGTHASRRVHQALDLLRIVQQHRFRPLEQTERKKICVVFSSSQPERAVVKCCVMRPTSHLTKRCGSQLSNTAYFHCPHNAEGIDHTTCMVSRSPLMRDPGEPGIGATELRRRLSLPQPNHNTINLSPKLGSWVRPREGRGYVSPTSAARPQQSQSGASLSHN
ncbi:hypothetical protein RRG08_020037 [Elysia crispata]|uniref:Uncharacterized protein n=1 Tax=Elysia crispata TaxID=231223 RepID=A0AAE1ECX5_9GAST|nr:hypothetical protein RRG08_020037 [Elysia crispata]